MYELPKIKMVPEHLYNQVEIEESFKLLGFSENNLKCLGKRFGDSLSNFMVEACNAGLEWVIGIEFFTSNKHILIVPRAFGISSELTPIELLSILCREWITAFGDKFIPNDLQYGKAYLEHIDMLRASRPLKPYMKIDREAFRFFINKIRKIHDYNIEDFDVEFSCKDCQLRILLKSTAVFVPAIVCNNMSSGKIYISAKELFNNIPKRFTGDTINISIKKDDLNIGSRILKARWEGPDVWIDDEYDNFLQKRILPHSLMYC